jgi:cardiolipin synthase
MTSQLDQVVIPGCRVWRSGGKFDHSKLLVADGIWVYVGSSNLDPRSLRLNFELDMEIYDPAIARSISEYIHAQMASGWQETVGTLRGRAFLKRLRNRVVWLASPYL